VANLTQELTSQQIQPKVKRFIETEKNYTSDSTNSTCKMLKFMKIQLEKDVTCMAC